MLIVAFIAGFALGGAAVWLYLRERITAQRRSDAQIETAFRALSADTLERTGSSFLAQATGKLEPLEKLLERFDEHVRELERRREGAYGALTTEVKALRSGQEQLRTETAGLVRALRAPATRGRWGEMQLKRALEMAGMLEHCDFVEQPTAAGENGLLRPDVVVRLAGGKNIVIDSKVPLEALLDAMQTEDDGLRETRMDDFVRHVREHMAKLSAKAYWQQFAPSPEFVVMFLASESFYRCAIEREPILLEQGPNSRVIIASPTTLISLLLAAASGWREETLAESARQVSRLGQELYERLATMGGHLTKLGGRLDKAVDAYNETVGSLESRVLPAARRFPQLGVPAKEEIPNLSPIERAPKPLTASELLSSDREDAADRADAA
jgi:DNA recombination protein RmuC